MKRLYGAGPRHLLSLLAAFALAGYVASRLVGLPDLLRLAIWFLGAVIIHDLVVYPAYALVDRALVRLGPRAVNYVRVPLLVSGLLLLVWFPLILGRSQDSYRSASGLSSSPFLGRWLLITAALFLGSAVLYAVRRGRRGANQVIAEEPKRPVPTAP